MDVSAYILNDILGANKQCKRVKISKLEKKKNIVVIEEKRNAHKKA